MSDINNPAAKEFIEKIDDLAEKMEELSGICPYVNNTGASKQLRVIAGRIDKLPGNELQDVRDVLIHMPSWEQLPKSIEDVLEKMKIAAVNKASGTCTSEVENKSDIIVNAANCSLKDCSSLGPTQVQVDDLVIVAASLDVAVATAQIVADAAAIISEKVGKVLQVVADVLDLAAKGAALAASIQQRAADVRAECEAGAVEELLLSMCNTLNDIDSKIDDIVGKLVVIDKKLDEILKIVNEIKDTVDEILLHQIEEVLSECKMLVDLYLPESAFGSISKVQDIVEKLISNSKLAGLTTANAEAYWRQGTIAIEKSQYERALQWFMLSYKQLQSKNVCSVPCPSNPCDTCK